MRGVHYQQSKNLLVAYSPKKLGFFQEYERRRLSWASARQAPSALRTRVRAPFAW